MVGELYRLLHQTLTEGTASDDGASVIVLNGTCQNLRGGGRALINQDYQRNILIGTASITTVILSGRLTPLGIDNQFPLRQELIGDLHSRGQITACITTQVDDQIREILLGEFGKGNQQLRIGILTKVLDLDIAGLLIEHITSRHTLRRYLTTCHGDMTNFLLSITDDTQFHLCILGTFQTMHSLLVGHNLTHKDRIIHLHNLVTCHQSSPFGRPVTDHILYTDGVLTDGKLNTHPRERSLQVVIGSLHILRGDIGRVRIQFGEDLRHRLLHQVVYIDCIHIHIIDIVEQIVEFTTVGIDDAQPVAGEMIGIEGSNQYA